MKLLEIGQIIGLTYVAEEDTKYCVRPGNFIKENYKICIRYNNETNQFRFIPVPIYDCKLDSSSPINVSVNKTPDQIAKSIMNRMKLDKYMESIDQAIEKRAKEDESIDLMKQRVNQIETTFDKAVQFHKHQSDPRYRMMGSIYPESSIYGEIAIYAYGRVDMQLSSLSYNQAQQILKIIADMETENNKNTE